MQQRDFIGTQIRFHNEYVIAADLAAAVGLPEHSLWRAVRPQWRYVCSGLRMFCRSGAYEALTRPTMSREQRATAMRIIAWLWPQLKGVVWCDSVPLRGTESWDVHNIPTQKLCAPMHTRIDLPAPQRRARLLGELIHECPELTGHVSIDMRTT